MAEAVLVLEGVFKGFYRGDDLLGVLVDVSLSVAAGEIVAVVGTRDQGKTTLLRVASGSLQPDRGSVRLWRSRANGALGRAACPRVAHGDRVGGEDWAGGAGAGP